jgi:hypothetical protein
VTALAVYNDQIYAAGYFNTAGGKAISSIARWNGGTWDSVGSGLWYKGNWATVHVASVRALAVYNGELYAAGSIDTAGSVTVNNIAKWNGTSWSAVGSGSTHSYVQSLIVYNGELYSCSWTIEKWDGSTWTAVTPAFGQLARSAVVYNGELYVGGEYGRVAKWNGSTWTDLPAMDNNVYSLAVYNGDLYAGGCFDTAGGVPASHIAKWDGNSWSALGAGFSSPFGMYLEVKSMTEYEGELYVGGRFVDVDGMPANNLAKWNGTSWSSMGTSIGLDGGDQVLALASHKCQLFIGGKFDNIGAYPCKGVAKYTPASLITANIGLYGDTYSTTTQLSSYQWYYAGYPIIGATSPTFKAFFDGSCFVEGLDSNGCLVQSAGLDYSLGIEAPSLSGTMNLYPNPNSGVFTVTGNTSLSSEKVRIEVRDITGRIIATDMANSSSNAFSKQINLKNVSPGMYILRAATDNATSSFPFMVK